MNLSAGEHTYQRNDPGLTFDKLCHFSLWLSYFQSKTLLELSIMEQGAASLMITTFSMLVFNLFILELLNAMYHLGCVLVFYCVLKIMNSNFFDQHHHHCSCPCYFPILKTFILHLFCIKNSKNDYFHQRLGCAAFKRW